MAIAADSLEDFGRAFTVLRTLFTHRLNRAEIPLELRLPPRNALPIYPIFGVYAGVVFAVTGLFALNSARTFSVWTDPGVTPWGAGRPGIFLTALILVSTSETICSRTILK